RRLLVRAPRNHGLRRARPPAGRARRCPHPRRPARLDGRPVQRLNRGRFENMSRRLIVLGRGLTAERVAALAGQLGYDELRLSEEIVELQADDHVVVAEDDPQLGRALLYQAASAEVVPAYL